MSNVNKDKKFILFCVKNAREDAKAQGCKIKRAALK